MQLLEALDLKRCSRANEEKIDATKEMSLIAQSVIKNVGQINNGRELLMVVARFVQYKIVKKEYYELLSSQFGKHLDNIDFYTKCETLYYLALTDIDSQYIFKTTHNLCSSFAQAFSQKLSSNNNADFHLAGLFSEQQQQFIGAALQDLEKHEARIIKKSLDSERMRLVKESNDMKQLQEKEDK